MKLTKSQITTFLRMVEEVHSDSVNSEYLGTWPSHNTENEARMVAKLQAAMERAGYDVGGTWAPAACFTDEPQQGDYVRIASSQLRNLYGVERVKFIEELLNVGNTGITMWVLDIDDAKIAIPKSALERRAFQ